MYFFKGIIQFYTILEKWIKIYEQENTENRDRKNK